MTFEQAVKQLLEAAELPNGQLWITADLLKKLAKKLDDNKD